MHRYLGGVSDGVEWDGGHAQELLTEQELCSVQLQGQIVAHIAHTTDQGRRGNGHSSHTKYAHTVYSHM